MCETEGRASLSLGTRTMDVTTLKQIITNSVKPINGVQTCTLSDSALQSTAVTQLFDQYLQADGNQLLITQVALPLPQDANSITVNGTGGNAILQDTSVSAVFSIQNGQAAVFLTAQGTAQWTFASTFPSLKSTFFPSLTFQETPILSLASYDVSPSITTGLSFSGTLVIASSLDDVAWLLNNPPSVPVSGPIAIQSGLPQITLAAPPGPPVPLGFFSFPAVTLTLCAVPTPTPTGNTTIVNSFIGLSANIAFEAQGQSYTIPLEAEVYYGSPLFLLSADPGSAVQAGLHELASLANGADLGSVIPAILPVSDLFQLSSLILQVNTANRSLASVRLGVQSSRPWPIMDVLTVESVGLSFMLADPLGKKQLSMAVFGEIGIGENAG